jgi:tRNA threonylcarbamoyladenosine biosynthesis protein TsaB
MLLLALHTTDVQASLAVDDGERLVVAEFEAVGARAPSLLAEVDRLLGRAGTNLAACTAIAVTIGPGSFTGVRVGIATAQGLAIARALPVWACGSLIAHAASLRGAGSDAVAVVLDARRGEVFAALYDVRDAVPRVLVPPFCAAPGAAAARLAGAPALGGPGAALVELPGARRVLPAPVPVAAGLVQLVRAGGCRKVAARDVEAEYLRKSDAELQRHGPRAE